MLDVMMLAGGARAAFARVVCSVGAVVLPAKLTPPQRSVRRVSDLPLSRLPHDDISSHLQLPSSCPPILDFSR